LVARATERRSDDAGGARIGAALARQPHAVAIGLRLARWMRPLDYREQMPAIELGNRILEHGWPPDADPAPLFELALGAPLPRPPMTRPTSRARCCCSSRWRRAPRSRSCSTRSSTC